MAPDRTHASALTRPFARLVDLACRHPRRTLLVWALLVLAAAPGLLRLELRTDGHALVPPDDPAVVYDRQVRERFHLTDPIAVVVETGRPGGLWDRPTLALVLDLSETLEDLPGLGPHGVTSLATEASDRVYPGTLDFRPFLGPVPADDEALERFRGDVEAVAVLDGTLVSEDRRATAVLVGVPLAGSSDGDGAPLDRTALTREVQRRVAEVAAEHPDVVAQGRATVSVVGAPVAEALLGLHLLADLARLLPLSLLVIALVLWLGCRRVWGVVLGMAEVGACLVWTFGLMGWLGVPVTLPVAVLPVILTTLGLADEIHVVWRHQRTLATSSGEDSDSAVRTTLGELLRPVVLTSATTAVGFLSFLASPLEPVASFGLFAALGIGFCLLFTVSALPAALALLPRDALARPRRGGEDSRDGLLAKTLLPLLASPRRRRTVLAGLAVVFVVLAAGGFRLTVEDGWIGAFSPRSELRRSTERIDALFGGTHLLRLHLDASGAPGDRPFAEPELLAAVGRLEADAAALPGVGRVLGPHVEIETASFLRFARDEQAREIPPSADRVERLLDRIDEARGAHRRREWLADDRRQAIVTLFIRDAGFRRVEEIMNEVAARAADELAPYRVHLGFAGDVAVSQAMIRAVVDTQLRSLALALLGAFVLLALLERSLTRALLVLSPVVAAVAAVLGTMGWAGIPLGVATSMFCAVTLGVGIDGAIHLVAARRDGDGVGDDDGVGVEDGDGDGARALRAAGPAIAADAVAIASGFALLGLSQVAANARLGLLVALALGLSTLATLGGLGAALWTSPADATKMKQSDGTVSKSKRYTHL